MLVEIPLKMNVSRLVESIKRNSSLIIHERHGNLKYKYGNPAFCYRGYYVNMASKNPKKIENYIQNQLEEYQVSDQITLKEYQNP